MRKLAASTGGGLVLAALAMGTGLYLEGGGLTQVLQPTAALIVVGGTLGAVLVQFPTVVVRAALKALRAALLGGSEPSRARLNELVGFGLKARKHGLVSLDGELNQITDGFLRKSLMLAVDGMSARELRDIMELELVRLEEQDERVARVWEAAGGYAPTFGILGAVLGLIQVMQRLDDLAAVGKGIAVAFVATIYGVGLANLVLLPLAGKLRLLARDAQLLRETTLEGVLSIVEGASPRTLREKLGAPAPVAQMSSPTGGQAGSQMRSKVETQARAR